MQRKVLIIAYHFPPRPGIGSQRPFGLYRYLGEYGWNSAVVTAKLPGPPPVQVGPVYESRYVDIFGPLRRQRLQGESAEVSKAMRDQPSAFRRWAHRMLQTTVAFPDEQVGWLPNLVANLRAAVERERPDILISTAPPPMVHIAAARVAQEYGLPWVADFRDLWTLNSYYDYGPIRKTLERLLELRTVRHAAAITTVTGPLADGMRAMYPRVPVYLITNSFDRSDFVAIQPAPDPERFVITHTGQLYGPKRDLRPFFQAVCQLIAAGKIDRDRFRVRLAGPDSLQLAPVVEQFQLADVVALLPPVTYRESLRMQMESTLLLLPMWHDPREFGTLPGKIFEYLGAGRPVLCMGLREGVAPALLSDTRAGEVAVTTLDIERALLRWWNEFVASGRVEFHGDASMIAQLERRNMVGKFVQVFEDVLAQSPRPSSGRSRPKASGGS